MRGKKQQKPILLYLVIAIASVFVAFFIYHITYKHIIETELRYGVRQWREILEIDRAAGWSSKMDPDFVVPILMPVCDRPQYLQRVLDGLARVNNIEQTVLVISQDCGKPEVTKIIRNIRAPSRVIHLVHTKPFLGIPSYIKDSEYATSANVHFLLTFGFEYLKAPAVIMLESDLVPSVDFYDYFMWAFDTLLSPGTRAERVRDASYSPFDRDNAVNDREQQEDMDFERAAPTTPSQKQSSSSASDSRSVPVALSDRVAAAWAAMPPPPEGHAYFDARKIFTVNSFTSYSRETDSPYAFEKPGQFMVWGWMMHKRHWPLARSHWTKFGNWDINMDVGIRQPHGLYSLTPRLSRCKNIGMTGINFNHAEDDPFWNAVYISDKPIEYEKKLPKIEEWEKYIGADA